MNLLKHFFTVGLSTLINILLSFFTTPVITRLVDPAPLGRLTVFNSYTAIMASLLYFGLNEALLRFFYEYKEETDQRKLLKLCFLIPISASLVLTAAAVMLHRMGWIRNDYTPITFILLCLSIVFTVWERMSNEMLQNTMNSKVYSTALIIKKAVYCLCTILLVILFKTEHFFILALTTTLSILFSAIIGTWATRKFWKFSDIGFPDNTSQIVRYSLPMYLYFAVYSIFDSIDKLFVDHFCNEYDVGVYGTAFSLVGIYSVVQLAFMAIWRPVQTKHYTENPDDMTFVQKGNRYITILMFFLGINTIMFKDVICMLLGPSYRPGAQLIPFLVFNPIMNTMIWTVTSGIEISRKSYLNVLIIVISLAILSGGSFFLIPRLGTKGSAVSVAVALIVQYYLTLFFSNRNRYVDYGTMKMTAVLILMLLFACHSTFYSLGYLTVVLYVLCLSAFAAFYHKDIKDMLGFLWESMKSRKES